MQINKNSPLVLYDIFVYDIKSCHYSILQKLGYDLSQIDEKNKKQRNTQIGYMMKDNPQLTSVLRSITISLVDEFILRNNVKPEEMICRLYDGLLITRPCKIFDQYTEFGLRSIYQNLIISNNRDSYIAIDNNQEMVIKGIANRYPQIDNCYYKLLKINYSNKQSIFKSLQKLKDEICNCEDPNLFCIPIKDKYEIFLKRYGSMKISETIINMLDTDEIDKKFYFEMYLKPFFDSIVITYI